MNNRMLRLLKKGLTCLTVLCLLVGSVGVGESAHVQPAERKTLFIGFNAGNHASDAGIQAYHEQAAALMKLLLMLESPGTPAVNVHYFAGGTADLDSSVTSPGSVSRFSWQSVKLLDALGDREYASRTGKPGWDLLNFLRARVDDVSAASEQGKVTLYWFDRFAAPNMSSGGPQVAQYARQLNAILARENVELYIAFASDSDGRLEAFQTQVINSLTGHARVHVFTYGDRTLEDGLRQLNDRDFGALYIRELDRVYAARSVQLPETSADSGSSGEADAAETADRQADDPRVREVTYDYVPVSGSMVMLLISGAKEITNVQLTAEEDKPFGSPLTIRRGGEAFVFLTDQIPDNIFHVRITSAEPDDSVKASAFLLPAWRAAVQVAEASGGAPLTLTRDAQAMTLTAGIPGLPQENISIRLIAWYTAVADRQYPGYMDFLAQAAEETADAFLAGDDSGAAEAGGLAEESDPADENEFTVEETEPADAPTETDAGEISPTGENEPTADENAAAALTDAAGETAAGAGEELMADAGEQAVQQESATDADAPEDTAGVQPRTVVLPLEESAGPNAPAQPVPESHAAYAEHSDQPVNTRITVQPESVEISGASENGDVSWIVTVPPLEIGQGQMEFALVLNDPEKSILKNGAGTTLAKTAPVAFTVENRGPEARLEAAEYRVYGQVPGMDDQPLRLNLDSLFTEADPDQTLLYYLYVDGVNYLRAKGFSVEGSELLIAPAEAGTQDTVTVRAYDPCGASAEIRITAHSISFQDSLESMRFGRPQQAETRVGEETRLTWSMPGALTSDYRTAQGRIPQENAAAPQYPQLPDLAQALQVISQLDRVTFDPFRWEGDQLTLSATVAASKASVDVAVQPQVSWTNGQIMQWPLNNLFIGSDVTVSTVNTAPYIRDAVEKTSAVTGYVKDVPILIPQAPLAVPVNGAEEFTLASLFGDRETDNSGLYYLILTNHPDVELLLNGAVLPTAETEDAEGGALQPRSMTDAAENDAAGGNREADPAATEEIPDLPLSVSWPDIEGRQDWRSWMLSGRNCDDVLALRIIQAGSADIEIYAWDEAELSEPVALHVQADSYFRHILTLGGIILAVLAALFCIAEIIYQRSRPTFRQVVMDINHRPFTSIRGQLELKYYGKKSVNFMTIMAAAGMPPVESLSSELLSNIELKPLRKDCFRIVLNGDAEKRVRIDFDGVKPDKNNTFSLHQQVSILSSERDEGIMICLTKQQ